MAVRRKAPRIWVVCFSCGSAVPFESLWIDDELLCRECAFRLMFERIEQSRFAEQECLEQLGPRSLPGVPLES